MPVEFTLAIQSRYDPDVQQLIFNNVFLPPTGNTLLLILMANGSYSGADIGPLAGQYDGLWPFVAIAAVPISLTDTTILLGGILETWPAPSPPYEVIIDPGFVDTRMETVTVTALDRENATITVTRSAPKLHPRGAIIRGDTLLVDDGSTPPLLYAPGEPTLAPALSGSWWAHIVSGGSADPSFALWQSRYWQSSPNLPVGHPIWATLSMLARRIDGTEASDGLYDPVTNQLVVALQGSVPSPFLFQPRGYLMAFSQTVEILPLPEIFGDLLPPADQLPTVPPDPNWPPFAWYYPVSSWTPRLVGTLPNNNEDLWLPILLSSKRSEHPTNVIEGWLDVTGGELDYPRFNLDENWFSLGNYGVRRQVASATFTATHDPNPITYDLIKVGYPPSVANVPNTTLGTSRIPTVGQHPWWELFGLKDAGIAISDGSSVRPPEFSADVLYVERLHTDDIMVLVAQSDGLGAPADPPGWTPIPEVSGPNAFGHQPVSFDTFLWDDVPVGASGISVALNNVKDLGPAPFTAVIAAGWAHIPPVPPAPPLPPIQTPEETVSVDSYIVNESGGFAFLSCSPSSPHEGGTKVVITNPGLLAYDQYVAAWWKIAVGDPPNEYGVPQEAEEAPPTISFPDATRCSARMYAVSLAEPTGPISPTVAGAARIDIPAPAQIFGGADVIPEDAITRRSQIALSVGERYSGLDAGGHPIGGLQDIRNPLNTFMLQAVSNPYLASYSFNTVDPQGVAVALTLAFRGLRERPPYELVDGHFAPNYINRGALPPCAEGGFYASSNMRTGYGLTFMDFPPPEPPRIEHILLQKAGMSGNTRYLNAWVWAEASGLEVKALIYTNDPADTYIWFEVTAGPVDFYPPPPPDKLFKSEQPFTVEISTRSGWKGLVGLLLWTEENCQPPTAASYGLTAAFRYRHKDLHMPSIQQASILG